MKNFSVGLKMKGRYSLVNEIRKWIKIIPHSSTCCEHQFSIVDQNMPLSRSNGENFTSSIFHGK